MAETLGMIASVLAIVGAVWALVRFILKPYIKKQRDYRNALKMIDNHFERWKEVGYSSRADSLIIGERFWTINKLKDRLRNIEKEKLAFLLRCAVQNGMKGKWGEWLVINKKNERIIPALVVALDGGAGWRPIWRSAYILEKALGKRINSLFDQLSDEKRENEIVQLAFKVMAEQGVLDYLKAISKGTDVELKRKAQLVLQEIEQFSLETAQYLKSRKRQSLEKLSNPDLYYQANDVH